MNNAPAIPASIPAQRSPGYTLGFALFLLVNVILFVRPSELFASLAEVPIYEIVIVPCLVFSLPVVLEQLWPGTLAERPVTFCVFGVTAMVGVSTLVNVGLDSAAQQTFEVAKVVAFYLLLVGLVRTSQRLRRYLLLLTILITIMTVFALLQFHGYVDIPAFAPVIDRETDSDALEEIQFPRLLGAGMFHDPNDLAQLLAVGVVLSLYAMSELPRRRLALLWLGPLSLMGLALYETRSRGGFLALVGALGAYCYGRFGLWRTCLLGALGLPVLLYLFAGRMTEISTSEGTAMQRLQIWSDGMLMFRQSPIIGIGAEQYAQHVIYVAHNSFLHAFAELGFPGGALFLGAFALAFWGIVRVGRRGEHIVDPDLARLRPAMLGATAGYAVGMLSLSRCYVVPTYLILGLAVAYAQMTVTYPRLPPLRLDVRTTSIVLALSVAFLLGLHLFIRLFVRWG
jgi:O-antigen ligase